LGLLGLLGAFHTFWGTFVPFGVLWGFWGFGLHPNSFPWYLKVSQDAISAPIVFHGTDLAVLDRLYPDDNDVRLVWVGAVGSGWCGVGAPTIFLR
jgi:hypothetical protein